MHTTDLIVFILSNFKNENLGIKYEIKSQINVAKL